MWSRLSWRSSGSSSRPARGDLHGLLRRHGPLAARTGDDRHAGRAAPATTSADHTARRARRGRGRSAVAAIVTLRRRRRHGDGGDADAAGGTGDLLRPDQARAEGRRRLRQPRGDFDRRLRIAQVRPAARSECFAFRAPPGYAKYLAAAGFTMMSNANNHSYDFGEAGRRRRSRPCTAPGSSRPGCRARSRSSRRRAEVAFIGFAPYSNTASLTDLDRPRG